MAGNDLTAGVDTVESRHGNVEDGDVGMMHFGELESLATVRRFRYDQERLMTLKKNTEPGAHYCVIVSQKNADCFHMFFALTGRWTTIRVPLPFSD